jgi:hypothetical protein
VLALPVGRKGSGVSVIDIRVAASCANQREAALFNQSLQRCLEDSNEEGDLSIISP